MISENGSSGGIKFLLAMNAKTVVEGQEATAITATREAIPVPPDANWIPLLSEWAGMALGKGVAIPTAQVANVIPAGTQMVIWKPLGQRTENEEPNQIRLLTRFRIEWRPSEDDGVPDLNQPSYEEFAPELHPHDVSELPKHPYISFDASTWTIAFDFRYREADPLAINAHGNADAESMLHAARENRSISISLNADRIDIEKLQKVVARRGVDSLKFPEHQYEIHGTFWATPAKLFFASGTHSVEFPMQGFADKDESRLWAEMAIELAKRNDRLRAKDIPMTPNSICPECGEAFVPMRKGQIYDKRACSARVGERRRYREQSFLASKK